ncbi:MAG: hypothetical protein IPO17_05635 [Flavobacteriales bacterium]|nr:hypothetical protein [Flavobacteriales bacterium]
MGAGEYDYHGSYGQDFNTLSSANGTTPAWTDNSTLANWYWQMSATQSTTYRVDNGGNNSGARMDYGTIASSDRAMGSLGSGTPGNFAWGVQLQNTSGTPITDLRVSFTGEQWRAANTTAHTATFLYKISASPITALTPERERNGSQLLP